MTNNAGDGTPSVPEPTTAIPTEPTQSMPVGSAYTYPQVADPSQSGSGAAGSGPVDLTDVSSKGSGRKGLIVGGVVAALALGGGVAFGVAKLSGGGAQPSDVLPASSFAYGRLDIDPSAGQKLAAVRFLSKLDAVKKVSEQDWRKQLWEAAVKDTDDDCVKKVNYDTDVAPWIGERAGFGMWPGGTKETPNVAVAIQTSNEAAAKKTIETLLSCSTSENGAAEVITRDGYAVITPKQSGYSAAVNKGTLSTSATFTADMSALGEAGVASAWADLKPLMAEGEKWAKDSGSSLDSMGSMSSMMGELKGSGAMALRFDASYIEIAGISRGMDGMAGVSGTGANLSTLPADTVGALSYGGMDQMVKTLWPQISKVAKEAADAQGQDDPIPALEEQLGMKGDEALEALLGKVLTLAVPDQDWGNGDPVFGVRIDSADGKKTEEVIHSIEDLSGESLPFPVTVDGNTVTIASDDSYAAKLKAAGTLGGEAAFKSAVGDSNGSAAQLFVNLDKLEKLYLGAVKDEQGKAFLEALSAVGMNVKSTGPGSNSYSLRIVGN